MHRTIGRRCHRSAPRHRTSTGERKCWQNKIEKTTEKRSTHTNGRTTTIITILDYGKMESIKIYPIVWIA